MALLDLLTENLTTDNQRMIVQDVYQSTFTRPTVPTHHLRTPKRAVDSLRGFYTLVNRAVAHYQERADTPSNHLVTFTEESVDKFTDGEIVTFSCEKGEPGVFGQSTPFAKDRAATTKNLKPMLREEVADPTNPGYNIATLGYWKDNIVQLTVWCRTQKQANKRVDWLEDLMMEYMWFFAAEGVSRTFYMCRNKDVVKEVNGNKWYGRPLDYFVRTEKIVMLSEKQIEQILFTKTLAEQ